ncbi:IS1634 family transposase [Flavobacterium sp.]|jgi:transposase|uniref:IS1634 family transposase n=1 Tax=Flavobacterium sp. TaxID=239 RepID=UPI0035AFE2F1
MFIRELRHKNGRIYIQVVDKSSGRYKVLKSFGSSLTSEGVLELKKLASIWINEHQCVREIDFTHEIEQIEQMLSGITQLKLAGIELVLGRIFDEIGFNKINDELFRSLVLYRLVYPKSKLKTTEYLYRYEQKEWSEDAIYRYMDKLHSTQKELVQQISYAHSLKVLGGQINVVFYDVTTLYFEIDQEDELRKTGFSKEGKHQNPQIILGLLVSKNGYPLAYDIYQGNKFEGHTLLPIINSFKSKYKIEKLTIIADSGLLSQSNIDELQTKNYEFILGARIKNQKYTVQQKILNLQLKNGESQLIQTNDLKLIVSYSDDRAKKDRYNREKGLRKLEKQVRTGKLTKSSINNRGYNKYLKLEGELNVKIDLEKFNQDAQWDGLKGYITNSSLTKGEILENYHHLWKIEKAFRIAKTDLKIRPIYHRLQRRIEAHICLTFAAYKVYKELERQLKEKQVPYSATKVIEIAQSIFEIEIKTTKSKEIVRKILLVNQEQKDLNKFLKFGC